MPIVTFQPSGKTIEVESGTTLFIAAQRAGLPVASSCSEELVCGKCNLQILKGMESLSPPGAPELKLLRRDRQPEGDRLSCQAQIFGDCTVTARYW